MIQKPSIEPKESSENPKLDASLALIGSPVFRASSA